MGKTVALNAYIIHGFAHAHEPIIKMTNLSSKSHGQIIWVEIEEAAKRTSFLYTISESPQEEVTFLFKPLKTEVVREKSL